MNKLVGGIYEKGTKIDSFGIGADFDAKMMKNIAEYAGGQFYFLETAQEIVPFVSKALENLVTAIGTDGNLKFRGKNDCIVRKVYQHPDLVGGAKLGDIHSDNIRPILFEVEISTTRSDEELEALTFEFSYLPLAKSEEIQSKVVANGTLRFKLTSDDSLLKEQNPSVQVFLVIQQSADSDLEIQNLIRKGDTKSAISAQEKQILELQNVLHLDNSGMIVLLIQFAEDNLKRLKVEGSTQNMEQNYSRMNYVKNRGEQKYTQMNHCIHIPLK